MWDPSHWRRKRPSAKTRNAVLWALRGGVAMSPHDLAAETGMAWRRVCAALDDLAIHGQVELDGNRYQRVNRTEMSA
jgi:DNA-binding transcriptional ArsR family regulator